MNYQALFGLHAIRRGVCLFDCTRHRNSQASVCDAKTNKGIACTLNKDLGQLCEWVSMDSFFFVTLSMEEFTLGSHSYSSLILQLIVYSAMSHFLKLIIVAASGVRRNFLRGEGTQNLAKEGALSGVWGRSPQPPTNF